jgi:hypothetical protein
MAKIALTGADTATINNYPISDLADGNCIELSFPNPIANVKTVKRGNAIFGFNASGVQAEVKLRLIRGGNDDKFLMNLLAQQNGNFAGTVLLTGTFIKKLGDGLGNITSDTYVLAAGIFEKIPEGKSNVEGETEQSVAMYSMKFASAVRVIT